MLTGDDTANLLYLVLLGAFLILVVARGQNLSGFLRYGLIWAAILGLVALGYNAFQQVRDDLFPPQTYLAGGAVEVPRNDMGQYEIVLRLNDVPVRFLIDTGATDIVLNRADAARVGLSPLTLDYTGTALTANGPVATATATVDTVALGERVDRDVAVSVNEGQLDGSLLGMAYLNRFGRVSIVDRRLRLEP
ncbi:MAG: retropepsin-like aspartic protease family protein [Hasllibacter sp.]